MADNVKRTAAMSPSRYLYLATGLDAVGSPMGSGVAHRKSSGKSPMLLLPGLSDWSRKIQGRRALSVWW